MCAVAHERRAVRHTATEVAAEYRGVLGALQIPLAQPMNALDAAEYSVSLGDCSGLLQMLCAARMASVCVALSAVPPGRYTPKVAAASPMAYNPQPWCGNRRQRRCRRCCVAPQRRFQGCVYKS
jgi:hypothetical protein